MNTTEEFIYKGYNSGLANERGFHVLRKSSNKDLYYLLKADSELEEGQKVEVNYNHTVPYKSGQLLLGASL